MSRPPEIWLRPEIQNLVTSVHDHADAWRPKGTYIDCKDAGCRRELLLRGGVECVKKQWFVARDRFSFSIPQPDGTTHVHEPGLRKHTTTCTDSKCEHDVVCSSPTCNLYFQDEWLRAHPRAGAGSSIHGQREWTYEDVPLISAAPEARLRPPTVAELEAKQAAEDELALQEVAIDRARQRARKRELFPTLR